MKNKKVIIVTSVIVIILLAVCFVFRNYIGNIIFNIRMVGVDKDIVIGERGGPIVEGGYASTYYDYYIDIDKKKIYRVEIYDVWGSTTANGEKGEHYTLKATKKLTDIELNKILDITKLESNHNFELQDSNISSKMSILEETPYYIIIYQSKTIEINKNTVSEIAQILDSMK